MPRYLRHEWGCKMSVSQKTCHPERSRDAKRLCIVEGGVPSERSLLDGVQRPAVLYAAALLPAPFNHEPLRETCVSTFASFAFKVFAFVRAYTHNHPRNSSCSFTSSPSAPASSSPSACSNSSSSSSAAAAFAQPKPPAQPRPNPPPHPPRTLTSKTRAGCPIHDSFIVMGGIAQSPSHRDLSS
jgi:hypothetical protein